MRKKKTAKIIIDKRKYFETTNINSAMIIVYDMTVCINTKKISRFKDRLIGMN